MVIHEQGAGVVPAGIARYYTVDTSLEVGIVGQCIYKYFSIIRARRIVEDLNDVFK